MANVCKTTITVVGLNDAAEIFVKVLSKAMFGVDLDNLIPKQWGEDDSVDGKNWYSSLVNEYRKRRSSARYCILYPYEPYKKLGVSAQRFYVETRNAPPVKELREASKAFPDLTFHLDWWLLQDGPSGELVIQNGDDIDEFWRPSSWYLFDHALLYPTVSLLPTYLPYSLAQRAALRVKDAIDTIENLREILTDSRFTNSPYEPERDPTAVEQAKRVLNEMLLQMKRSAEHLTFEGVILGVQRFRHQDQAPPSPPIVEERIVDIDEL